MPDNRLVAHHYTHGGLLEAIRAGVERMGKTPQTVSVQDLAAADEFHIGGREATEAFLDQLGLSPENSVLDVGCGIGGSSRFVAERYGSRVTGIDLTEEFVETGRALCAWVGLAERITLDQGSATAMPYGEVSFDKAFMLHVGMNIPDKAGLFAELHRVLRPGGVLGVYDVMRIGEGDLSYPVPWATTAETNALARPEDYDRAMAEAGFEPVARRVRGEFAKAFFAQLQARVSAAGGPPPLGLHILMGATAPAKIANMVEAIAADRVVPVEMIARKPASGAGR